MAKYTNTIEYNLKTTLDTSGISKLQSEIHSIESELNKLSSRGMISEPAMTQSIKQVKEFREILSSSFNNKLGMLDMSKVTSQMKAANISLSSLHDSFSSAGVAGETTFNNMVGRMLNFDTGLKSVSSTADKVFNTLGNTVRWGVIASGFQTILNKVQESTQYVIDLDTSLNNIRIVSGQSADEMSRFAKQANSAAQSLGKTTTDYTNAALIFYQQGYDQQTSQSLADVTLKTANVTQQDTAAVSEELTALYNGYKIDVTQAGAAEEAVDKLAKVAAIGASDLEELATAESKVASTASTLGVSQDQLAAQISTVISVTRQAPENVGNALKTIYARLGDLKLGDTLDDGTSLGKVSKTLEEVGVSVLDTSGNMRSMGEVIEDLMGQWKNLSTAQQQAVAVQLAGKYQYNNLIALLNNQEMYTKALNASETSLGTLDEQQNIYMQSTQAKINTLQTSFEGLINEFADGNAFNPFIEGITNVTSLLDTMVKSVGGGSNALLGLGSVFGKVFSDQIGRSINNIYSNFSANKIQKKSNQDTLQMLQAENPNTDINLKDQRDVVNFATRSYNNYVPSFNKEEGEQFNKIKDTMIATKNAEIEARTALQNDLELFNSAYMVVAKTDEEVVKLSQDGKSVDWGSFFKDFQEDSSISQEILKQYEPEFEKIRSSFFEINIAAQQATSSLPKELGKSENELISTTSYIEDMRIALLKVKDSVPSQTFSTFNEALDALDEEIGKTEPNLQKIQRSLNELEKTSTQKFDLYGNTLGDPTKLQEESRKSLAAASAAKSASKSGAEFLDSQEIKKQISNVSQLVSGVGQLAFGVQSLKSIGSIWSNTDEEIGEKILDTVINLSMALPMLIDGFRGLTSITDIIRSVGTAKIASNMQDTASEVANKVATDAATASKEKQAEASTEQAAANQASAAAATEDAAAQTLDSEATSVPSLTKNSKGTWIHSDTGRFASKAEVESFEKLGASAEKAAPSIAGVAAAETAAGDAAIVGAGETATLGASFLAILPEVAAVVAVAAVLGVGIYALVKAYNADADAAKDAADKASSLSNVYSSLNTEYSTLQSNIQAYQKSRDAIDSLTKGTQQWKDAISDANDKMLDLINNYPELAKYIQKTSNGELYVSDEDLSKVLDEKKNQVQDAQMASSAASIIASNAQQKADRTSLGRKITYQDTIDTSEGDVMTMSSVSTAQLDKIIAMGNEQGKDKISDSQSVANALGVGVSDPIVAAIVNSANKITDFMTKSDAQDAANTVKRDSEIQGLLNQDSNYKGFSVSDNNALVSILGNMSDSKTAEEKSNLTSDSFDTISQKYADAMGMTISEENKNFWNEDGKTKFTDSGGTVHEVTRDAMESAIASANAMKDAASQWNDVANKLLSIDTSSMNSKVDNLSEVVSSGANGQNFDFSGLTDSDVQDLAKGGSGENGQLTQEDLGINDDIAQTLGYDDANAYMDAFNQQVADEFSKRKDATLAKNSDTGELELTSYDSSEVAKLKKATGVSDEGFQNQEEQIQNSSSHLSEYSQNVNDSVSAVQDQIKALKEAGKTTDDSGKSLDSYNADLKNAKKDQKEYDQTLNDVAASSLETADGLKNLSENIDDNVKAIRKGDKSSTEYVKAMDSVKSSMEEVLNVSKGSLSDDFVTQHLDQIQQLAAGDTSVLQDLRNEAAQDIVTNMTINGPTQEDIDNTRAILQSDVANLTANMGDVEIGASLDDQDFINTLNGMMASGAITAEQVSDLLNSIGYQPSIGTQTVTKTDTHHYTKYVDGEDPVHWDETDEYAVEVPVINADATVYKGYTPVSSSGSASTPSPSGGSGGSSGGGGNSGGGSGSGSTYEPKTKDNAEDDYNRYEKVDTALKGIDNELDKINTEQDRLSGYERSVNMSKQIDYLNQQIDLQKQRLELEKQEAAEKQSQLASMGASFNSEGYLQNYKDLYYKYFNNLNNLINRYNASADESTQDSLDAQIEAAQKNFDKFKNLADAYDTLVSDTIKGTESDLEDLQDKIEDLQITAFNDAVEATDNIKDIQEAWIEFNQVFSSRDSDDPFRAMATSAEKLRNYFQVALNAAQDYYDKLITKQQEALKSATTEAEKKTIESQLDVLNKAKAALATNTIGTDNGVGYLDMQFNNLNTILKEIDQFQSTGTSDIFGKDSADMWEAAKNIFDAATDAVKSYEEEVENLRTAITDGIDDISDRMEKRQDQYSAITDELEHQKDLVTLLRGEDSYTELNSILNAQNNNYQAQISEVKQELDYWTELQKSMKEGSDEWQAIEEKITDTQSNLNDLVQKSLEAIQEAYKNAVNSTVDNFVQGLSGSSSGLDFVSDEWEMIQKNSELWLDNVNAGYDVEKLQSKYLQMLDGTNDLSIQKQITDQMNEQLSYLREKNKLSQYDIDYANAQLDILQKTIALQEAQQNKTQLKLKRNTQGNYSYVYSANEEDVAQKQQDLLDSQDSAYNLSRDAYKQNLDSTLSAMQDWATKVKEIQSDATLTEQQRQEQLASLEKYYGDYINGLVEQNETIKQNYVQDTYDMYNMLADENKEKMKDTIAELEKGNTDAMSNIDTAWGTAIHNMIIRIGEGGDFTQAIAGLYTTLNSELDNYNKNVEQTAANVGESFDTSVAKPIQNCIDKTTELNSVTSTFLNQLDADAGSLKSYESSLADYAGKIADVTNKMNEYQAQVGKLQTQLTAKEQENTNLSSQLTSLQAAVNNGTAKPSNGGSGGSSSAGGASGYELARRVAADIWWYGSNSTGWGYGQDRWNKFAEKGIFEAQDILDSDGPSGALYYDYNGWDLNPYNYGAFDTGGYTGEWNDGSGKVALLHSKELVLNANDTENMLAAINAVRDMAGMLQGQGVNSLSSIPSDLLNAQSSQEITINADFPNATDRNEIQEALLSLPLVAAQYANRTLDKTE